MEDNVKAKKILFIRHAQCVANTGKEPIISGDSPLTEKGHAQAKALAERLAQHPISSLHASSLERARVTASYIGEINGQKVHIDDLYIERLFPESLIGKTRKHRETVDLYRRWEESFIRPSIDLGGGENYERLKERGKRVLSQIASMDDPYPAIVTHGYLIRMVFALVYFGETLTPDIFRPFQAAVVTTNTGISLCELRIIEHLPEWRVLSWNDHSHLNGLLI
jgi:broad specificity phosphatase PhoE